MRQVSTGTGVSLNFTLYFKVFSAFLVYMHAYMCVGEFICLPHCVIYYWLIVGEGHKNFLFQFIVGKTEMQGIGILGP